MFSAVHCRLYASVHRSVGDGFIYIGGLFVWHIARQKKTAYIGNILYSWYRTSCINKLLYVYLHTTTKTTAIWRITYASIELGRLRVYIILYSIIVLEKVAYNINGFGKFDAIKYAPSIYCNTARRCGNRINIPGRKP